MAPGARRIAKRRNAAHRVITGLILTRYCLVRVADPLKTHVSPAVSWPLNVTLRVRPLSVAVNAPVPLASGTPLKNSVKEKLPRSCSLTFSVPDKETLVVIVPGFFVVGIALEAGFLRFKINELTSLIVTFGLTVILESLIQWIWTADFRRLEWPYTRVSLRVGTLFVGLTNLLWLPLSGALSDKIGRRPILLACTMLALITAYPAMSWLVAAPSFGKLLAVELWLSFIFGCWNGAMIPFLTEIMPAEVRTAGFSLAYSLATAIFGGFTPMIVTWLIHVTGNKAMPGAWLSLAALCGLLATLVTLGLESEVNVEVQPAAAAVAA